MRLRFEDCVLDSERHEVTRSGDVVPLSPKAFRLLEVLAERRPRVVAKAELRPLLWPDAVVGGTSLARLVNELRAAIGDDARPPRLIRTVPRVGYAFSALAVEEVEAKAGTPAPECALEWGIRQLPLPPGEHLIGRATDALVSVPSAKVSRRHARIVVAHGRAVLEDLGSKNGTYVGDRRIEGPTELRHGDRIEIGPIRLVFRTAEAEGTTATDLGR
jgi:DNA-binding winged helix-turn-helix (wHTH) protein